ncbi:MAG: regulatory protein [Desulfovibrionaceae bacterium]|nr:MAG: regulatory protein [Desulfovibrionaceae bacterium]
MPRDWFALLTNEVANSSIAATARRLGYSRTAISLAMAEKYPGATDKLASTVLAVLGTLECPHLGLSVTPAKCASSSGKMPTSSPGDLRLWRACQTCPNKPQIEQSERRST